MGIDIIKGWHFLPTDGRLANDDGRIVRAGETYFVTPPAVICKHGLHWSRKFMDALSYAPGPILCRVESVPGHDVISQDDKDVSTARHVIAMADATDLLWELSRKFAADVFWKHFKRKDYPDVVRWLDDGDFTARYAARSAARSAAEYAARSAAEYAARSAAWSAAWSAARSAAEYAARSAAWSAAWSAAEYAARSAAWSAAWSAAEYAAWSAARSAAWSVQNSVAEEMAKKLLNCE